MGSEHRGRRARAAFSGLLALVLPAHAAASDLVLVDSGPEWRDAVAVALDPWGTEVRAIEDAAPRPDASPSERGVALAARTGGAVVVWFQPEGSGSVLWLYDATTRSAIGRELPTRPPFDPVTAAAVALSLKTLLRHSAVGPSPPSPTLATTPLASQQATAASPPAENRAWTIALSSGVRAFATAPDTVEVRVTLSGLHWLEATERHLGIGVRAAHGSGVEVRDARFDGRWVEGSVELLVAGRVRPIAFLELDALVGFGVSAASLSGELQSAALVDDWRANPNLSAEVAMGFRLSAAIRLGLRVGADVLFQHQRYLVTGQPVLQVRSLAFTAALGLEVSFGD